MVSIAQTVVQQLGQQSAKSPLKALLVAWLQEVQQPASGEAATSAAGQEAALNSLNIELLLVQET